MAEFDRDLARELCDKPCRWTTYSERRLFADGTEEVTATDALEWCSSCPERDNPTPGISSIEVVLDYRGLHG